MKTLQRLIQGTYFITFCITTFMVVSYIENDMNIPNIVLLTYVFSAELSFAKMFYSIKKPVRS